MSRDPQATTIDSAAFDAVIFDLDGVITDTAEVHLEAWIRMFNGFLEQRADGGDYEPFTRDDYFEYVDGRPRYDGVRTFLESRGIDLPDGDPSDSSDAQTVCGLGNRKNDDFRRTLAEGVDPYASSVALIETLLSNDIRAALVSSSRNAGPVLEAAALGHLFEVRVDGNDVIERGLPGKPDPALFLDAAMQLGIDPGRAAVVEDAISGVQAGSAGNFALVIGVDRTGQADELLANGADVVVSDLGELTVARSDPQA